MITYVRLLNYVHIQNMMKFIKLCEMMFKRTIVHLSYIVK